MQINRSKKNKVTFNFNIDEKETKEVTYTEQDIYEVMRAFYATCQNNECDFIAFKGGGAILHQNSFKKFLNILK